jgi:hypothetical protein
MRNEAYDIKSDGPNKVRLLFTSQLDGTLMSAMIMELPVFAPVKTVPAILPPAER